MPLQYSGIVDEHLAVRRAVGLFDVSHMGKIFIEGPMAHAFLDRLSANDVPTSSGKARYTHLLREDGTILDDVLVTCLAPDRFLLVGNAGPRAVPPEIEGWGKSSARRASVPPRGDPSVAGGRASFLVTRTGYTGEAGFELFPTAAEGLWVWGSLLKSGADLGIQPIGLGARDTLRLERGYLLSGQAFGGHQAPAG